MTEDEFRDEREIKNEIEKLWVNATIQELECIEMFVKAHLGRYDQIQELNQNEESRNGQEN